MKHKWFWGRLKGIRSIRLWRTTEKPTEKKRQGGFLPDLRLAKSLGEVSKARSMKALTQETLQKCSSLLHAYHNTEQICCVGRQASHLKKRWWYHRVTERFCLILWAGDIWKVGKAWVWDCAIGKEILNLPSNKKVILNVLSKTIIDKYR